MTAVVSVDIRREEQWTRSNNFGWEDFAFGICNGFSREYSVDYSNFNSNLSSQNRFNEENFSLLLRM